MTVNLYQMLLPHIPAGTSMSAQWKLTLGLVGPVVPVPLVVLGTSLLDRLEQEVEKW